VRRLPAPQHWASRLPTASSRFKWVTHDNVVVALPNKQCTSDPIQTWLLKECLSELVPFLCCLVNACRTSCVQVSVHMSASQKTQPRHRWCEELLPGLEFDCIVETAWEAGRSAVARLLVRPPAAARPTICLPSLQVHRDCHRWTHVWHSVGARHRWHSCPSSARPICIVQHGGRHHRAPASANFVWSEQHHPVMVSLVPGPASAAWVSPQQAVGTVHRPVRKAAGIRSGPAPVHDIHGRRCQHRQAP